MGMFKRLQKGYPKPFFLVAGSSFNFWCRTSYIRVGRAKLGAGSVQSGLEFTISVLTSIRGWKIFRLNIAGLNPKP